MSTAVHCTLLPYCIRNRNERAHTHKHKLMLSTKSESIWAQFEENAQKGENDIDGMSNGALARYVYQSQPHNQQHNIYHITYIFCCCWFVGALCVVCVCVCRFGSSSSNHHRRVFVALNALHLLFIKHKAKMV